MSSQDQHEPSPPHARGGRRPVSRTGFATAAVVGAVAAGGLGYVAASPILGTSNASATPAAVTGQQPSPRSGTPSGSQSGSQSGTVQQAAPQQAAPQAARQGGGPNGVSSGS